MLSRVEEELPSTSDVAKVDSIEIQEIMKNSVKSTENLIKQLKGSKGLPMRELIGLDKQLRSIRGSLKVETTKNIELQQCIKQEKCRLKEIIDNPEHDDGIQDNIWKRIERYNDELKARQESINLPEGRLTSQIPSFKEMITKVLDKHISLAERI